MGTESTAEAGARGLAFSAEGLCKIYKTGDTEVHALRGVDLAIPSGEILVLLGPSGSGKSTLPNIIGGLDRRDHYPAQLSGGEQQRVAVARAIAKQPSVLLCDEPAGALDSATGIRVLEALAQANRDLGTTVVIITHNAGIAAMANRVLRFLDGRIARIDVNAQPTDPSAISW